jgi:hypothetical protein
MSTLPFKDLLSVNETELKSFMKWENYDLNETVIPVVDLVQDHALMVLSKSYGLFHVEQDILDELCADVFIYFPVLLQQLAITRLIDAYGVVKDDTDTITTNRTEVLQGEVEQNSALNVGTTVTDTSTTDMQAKTTGTVSTENDGSNTQNSTTNIENTSGVEATGGRSVNLSHNMPEQGFSGTTGNFPVDPEGTPILTTAFVQSASQSFNTANPITNNETSEQTIINSVTNASDSVTTNDITVEDTGTIIKAVVNSGADNSESTTSTDTTNTINETVSSVLTNKQYAYEIKAFLETADGLIAFQKWESKFSWVIGIV